MLPLFVSSLVLLGFVVFFLRLVYHFSDYLLGQFCILRRGKEVANGK